MKRKNYNWTSLEKGFYLLLKLFSVSLVHAIPTAAQDIRTNQIMSEFSRLLGTVTYWSV